MQRLVPDDAEDVAELDMLLFPDNCFNARTIRMEIEAGEGYCLREFHGALIGYALVRTECGLRDLTRIGVRPSKQGRGYGQRLIEGVLEDAELNVDGYEGIMLCVRKGQDDTIRWYRRLGFTIVGELEASWTMVRHIDDDLNVRPQMQL